MIGQKFDSGKLDYTLLPWDSLTEVVKVLEAGAKKYSRDNWQKVPNGKARYLAAAFRHLVAYATHPKQKDPETGLSHLGHCCCCLLFILWFDKVDSQNQAEPKN